MKKRDIFLGLCLVLACLCIGCLPSKEEVQAVITKQESKGGLDALTLKDGRKVTQYVIPFEGVPASRWHYVYVVENSDGNISSITTNKLIPHGKTSANHVEAIIIEGKTYNLVSAEKEDSN